MQKIRNYLQIERFVKLSKREKVILASGAAFLIVFIVFAGIIMPLLSYKSELNATIASKDEQLVKIYELASGINAYKELARKGDSPRDANFTLFRFLEEQASKIGINERIEYMKPISDMSDSTKESVEVKIRGIYQEDLISLLYGIESCPSGLRIKRLNIRRVERDKNLDVTFQVVFYG